MRKRCILNKLVFVLLGFLLLTGNVFALTQENVLNKTQLVSQQTELLKNRLAQAQRQLATLQHQQDDSQLSQITLNHTTRQIHSEASLDIAVAKSNLDSLSIELAESQQSILRIEKDMQEIENQLNIYSVFGLKTVRSEAIDVEALKNESAYQENLLTMEQIRADYLTKLKKIADQTLSLQNIKYARLNVLLKSRTITKIKERLAVSETSFQQQQSFWLQRLNSLNTQLNVASQAKVVNKNAYANLQREIFYANENLNFIYVQMLIVRYQDQLQQLKVMIAHSRSVTVLNKATDQAEMLARQLSRVQDLLTTRLDILKKRENFLAQDKSSDEADKIELDKLSKLANQFDSVSKNVLNLNGKLLTFRATLNSALQYELSSRQGLPGLDSKDWYNLGAELWLVPTLTYEVFRNLAYTVTASVYEIAWTSILLIALIEISLVTLFIVVSRVLARVIAGMAEQELGHINLKRLCIALLRRNLIGILIIGNIIALFTFENIPTSSTAFLINLALVWLFFKVLTDMAKICLVESVHDRGGHDVLLYHRLKWSFLIGGMITALTVFIQQLPVVYEVKDLFDRLFLLFMLVVSVFLLKSWEVLLGLISPHIDERRLYLKKVVRLLGMLLPFILLVNSAIGLFGYVNLVLTVSWYESIFVMMMVGYLIVRGILIDTMILLSTLMIRHVNNGWLWTEAFLKPIDKVLRISLFLFAWLMLFVCYGWNQQSPVISQLNHWLNYPLVNLLNTTINPLSIIELIAVVSLLFWAARWTREFVYRALSSRTKDMGLRNSIAIFSQYATIIIGIFICLRVLGIDLKSLAVVAGAFAFGVGLGLRDLFNNFACGFLLLIERPVRVGDTVSIDTYEGEVTHIGGRAVTVRTWDHMEVIVPNAEIFSKSFTNWTSKDTIVRTIITLKISRQDSPYDVQALIHNILANHKDVLSDPLPEVLLKEISDSLMEFEVRYFINLRQIKSRIGLRSEVLLAIWEAFEKHGMQPPYPHHEISVKGNSPLLTQQVQEHIFQTENSGA
jgi:potassium efflux system protein